MEAIYHPLKVKNQFIYKTKLRSTENCHKIWTSKYVKHGDSDPNLASKQTERNPEKLYKPVIQKDYLVIHQKQPKKKSLPSKKKITWFEWAWAETQPSRAESKTSFLWEQKEKLRLQTGPALRERSKGWKSWIREAEKKKKKWNPVKSRLMNIRFLLRNEVFFFFFSPLQLKEKVSDNSKRGKP